MSACLSAACGCPGWMIALAFIGGILVYLFFGWLLYRLAKEIWENLDKMLAALVLMLWPVAIAVGVIFMVAWGIFIVLSAIWSIIYWFIMYFAKLLRLGVTGVEIDDLVKSERKIERKISESESNIRGDIDNLAEVYQPIKPVKKPKQAKKVVKKAKKKKAKK